jgi:hypothetical protein
MRIRRPAALLLIAIVAGLVTSTNPRAERQDAQARPDLTGRWTLNRELSENAEAKLAHLHAGGGGGHGPARHFRGGGGGQAAAMNDLRNALLRVPAWFTLAQNADRIVVTDDDGRVRSLAVDGRRDKGNGRDVRTRWDDNRLVSEISLGNATVTETYERAPAAPQLLVTTRAEMGGQVLNVRRVYDATPGSK